MKIIINEHFHPDSAAMQGALEYLMILAAKKKGGCSDENDGCSKAS